MLDIDTLSWILGAFFSKNSIALYCIVITIIVSIKIYKVWGRKVKLILWIFSTFVAIIIVFGIFVAIANVVVNDLAQRPSSVDVSPIERLNKEQVSNIEETIMLLIDQGILRKSNFREFPETHTQSHAFTAQWIPRQQTFPVLSFSVRVFRYENYAISNIRPPGIGITRRDTHSCYIYYENNTSALLMYPSMIVSASGLYLPRDDRWVESDIRIGNIVFGIIEIRPWYDLRTSYTTQFIEMLVEASMSEFENNQ